jgi:hypothetical protein
MRDEVDRVVAGHVLLLQEVGGVRFAFGEDRDQDVRAGDFGAADMKSGALEKILVDIRKRGMARVYSEDATAPGGQVFVRVAASGANTEIGRFRATAAAGCVLLPQARWQTARNGQNLAIVSLNID